MKRRENTMNKTEMKQTALQLKALLTVLSEIDTDNAATVEEIPHALKPAGAFSCLDAVGGSVALCGRFGAVGVFLYG